ncbi:MAG: hypothetical protein ACRDOE_00535 [Streptosporangiaceae bacterium]
MTATATAPQTLTMQGIAVPASSVNPAEFFRRTRRLRFKNTTASSIQGFGNTDSFTLRQTGIIAALSVKVFGTLTVALGGGTCASTARWPYDLIKRLRVSANGQSNIVNASGAKLRAREFMAVGDLTDRGVSQGIGGASPGTATTQGTLSMASEAWGVGQNVTAIASSTPDVELHYIVPLAWDSVKLLGAIFAQTASTQLEIDIDWAPVTDLFTLTGAAAVTQAFSVFIEPIAFSIPEVGGQIVVPDLSVFHSFIQSNDFTAGSNVESEINLQGQGVGRQLMRVFWQLWNGAAPQAPLALTAANFPGNLGWRYGGNDTPEIYADGRVLRMSNEKLFSVDMGAQGFAVLDFASQWAFRDSVDEGTATNLRLVVNAAALTSPRLEITQETIFAGATGA